VLRVRLDRKATAISLLVVLGERRDGQKVLLAVKNMGGESEAAWRSILYDRVARGPRTPGLLITSRGFLWDAGAVTARSSRRHWVCEHQRSDRRKPGHHHREHNRRAASRRFALGRHRIIPRYRRLTSGISSSMTFLLSWTGWPQRPCRLRRYHLDRECRAQVELIQGRVRAPAQLVGIFLR
jgi:hypothetical protein